MDRYINIGGHKVTAGSDYSTSEVKTADRWIDGKPIYRKVVNINGTTDGTDGSIAINQTSLGIDIDTPIYLMAGNKYLILPRLWNTNDKVTACFYKNGTDWSIEVVTNRIAYPNIALACVIEYTKTTD